VANGDMISQMKETVQSWCLLVNPVNPVNSDFRLTHTNNGSAKKEKRDSGLQQTSENCLTLLRLTPFASF
jgi:hypothetical protein